jgi:hypothetical protein
MASKEAFAAACIELFSRLWAELNALSATADPARGDEILRLELILVLDACRSARWRILLDGAQRLTLECLVRDVFDALNSSPGEFPCTPIEWAQNRLLDALLEHCRQASTLLLKVSGRKNRPITKVAPAMTMGYQSP